MISNILSLSRNNKQIIIITIDSVIVILALLISFSLRLDYLYFPSGLLAILIFGSPLVAIPIFFWFHLYSSIIRYIGFEALWSIVQAVSLFALLWGILGFMAGVGGIPRSVILINWIVAIGMILTFRFSARWILNKKLTFNNSNKKNVAIYGAGSAGRQLSFALKHAQEYNHVAFIDDNEQIQGHSIHGVKVYSPSNLESLINKKQIEEFLLAIPSVSRIRRSQIIEYLEPFALTVRSMPSVSELAQGKVQVDKLRKINISDLLGREQSKAQTSLLKVKILNKVVLVTGAGGSIGSELCRQIISIKPKKLILFEINEFSLYKIEEELKKLQNAIEIIPILGSIRDQKRVESICINLKVETIYHSAAYKHVPLVEFNQSEGVLNNVIGTMSVAQAAINTNVNTFVLISTDKAVRPSNTMGATKRVAELILQAFSKLPNNTCFTMVRFGNVLNSSGSVIPLFQKQIESGGPITVTDIDIVRFFMTIPEAVELVIQAGAMGTGGEVFVLDMGEPVKIYDLAKKMIQLSGLHIKDTKNPDGDIAIKITGLRPGEKLYEELLIDENSMETDNPLIMKAEEKMLDWVILEPYIEDLHQSALKFDNNKVRELLIKVVPEFKPQSSTLDYVNNYSAK
ncbi:polysaccharide biosynthesis protein [Candidatus Pseudothioglobus singularis]|nr:polysaccharide biosynthesis protein [Candidatus Pseudothioglobus singularis]